MASGAFVHAAVMRYKKYT